MAPVHGAIGYFLHYSIKLGRKPGPGKSNNIIPWVAPCRKTRAAAMPPLSSGTQQAFCCLAASLVFWVFCEINS